MCEDDFFYTNLDSVLEFIETADNYDLQQIKIAVNQIESVEDELKHNLINEALKKYSLTELEEKLK